LLAAGIPMKAIQEWLGHSTFATTADTYSHLDFNSKKESAQMIGLILGGKSPEDLL
jgi:integrase